MLKLFILLCFSKLEMQAESAKVYKMLKDYHITSPIHFSITCNTLCRETCVQICGCDVGCASLSVNQELHICHIHHSYIYDEDSEYSGDEGWEYWQLATEHVMKGDWTLVFRLTPNIGQTSMSTWSNSGHHDDPANKDGVPPGCQTVNSSKSCDRHFRSSILDDWTSYNIQEVKLELYKDGVSKHNIIFDGTGSDYMSWFDGSTIISSTWTDITTATFLYFTMNDHDGRKFYIVKSHEGCPNDFGWLSVQDSNLQCAWETKGGDINPKILYSSGNTASLGDNFDVADVLAVFVKY